MPNKHPKKKQKDCLIIAPIADEATPERAQIWARAKYLEKQIAAALKLKPLGYKATLITSDKSKHWITPHMIRRLTSDPLAVAVLDGSNPNCMYEIGIRHAFCLPMICLIEKNPKGPSLPFNVQDVVPLEYPALSPSGAWPKKHQDTFRRALKERAELAITAKPSGNFTDALNRISAVQTVRLIFAQKQAELESLKEDLEAYRHFLRKDYDVKETIANKAAKRLFEMIDANNRRVAHRNEALRGLAGRQELLHLDKKLESCHSACEKIAELAEQLADVARRLNLPSRHKSGPPPTPPTRGQIDKRLRTILRDIGKLHSEIVTLLKRPTL